MSAEDDYERDLLERDREIEELNEAADKLQEQVDALAEERDKYQGALNEIFDLANRAL